jgi:hypothetical protein
MKLKLAIFASILLSLTFEQMAQARNDRIAVSIAQALAEGKAKGKIDPNIPLFFGKATYPKVEQKFTITSSSRKTNAVGKSDSEACVWAFLSTVIALQDSARKDGGNAIIEIKSLYGHAPLESDTEFVCSAGSIVAGVQLEGTVVKLAKTDK